MSTESEQVIIDVTPELAELLRRPEGIVSKGRVRLRLCRFEKHNVLTVEELPAEHGAC